MDLLEAIHTRRSIRKYQDRPVPQELIKELLAGAMSAPSAGNAQPWHFLVITDSELLDKVPSINPYAAMAKSAPLAILICADLSLEKYPGNWVLDCAAAVQNLLLAAHAGGLGAVWTGIYPDEDRMEGFRQLLSLPENIVAHTLVPLGYPSQQSSREDRYKEERVHFNRW
jgi:nitroreductase